MPLLVVTVQVVLLGRRIEQSKHVEEAFVDSMMPGAGVRVVKL